MVTINENKQAGEHDYKGLSTDTKPTETVGPNSLFFELDTGDFVSSESIFLNNLNDTLLSDSTDRIMSADYLSDDRIFVAYVKNSALIGQIFTVNNWEITAAAEVTLVSDSNLGTTFSGTALNENSVFIAYQFGSNSYLRGIICTIDGANITVGTQTEISNATRGGSTISMVKLTKNKVFIAHSHGTIDCLSGILCTINGTTITHGTDTDLMEMTSDGRVIFVVALNKNKVFVAHNHDRNNNRLYGVVCEIDGSTITHGSPKQIATVNYTGKKFSAVTLNENKVFIAHGLGSAADSTDDTLKGAVCEIDGTSIINGTDTVLQDTSGTGNVIDVAPLNKKSVYVFHNSADYHLCGILCNMDEALTGAGNDIQLLEDGNTANTICAISSNGKATVVRNLDDSLKAFAGESTISAFYKGRDILVATKTDKNLDREGYYVGYLALYL